MSYHPAWASLRPDQILDSIRFRANPDAIRTPAFAVIDALQRFAPAIQIEAVFAAAVILARTLNVDPHELIVRARRQAPDLESLETNASVISDYAKGELR